MLLYRTWHLAGAVHVCTSRPSVLRPGTTSGVLFTRYMLRPYRPIPCLPSLGSLKGFTNYMFRIMSSDQTPLAYTIQQTVCSYLTQIHVLILLYLCHAGGSMYQRALYWYVIGCTYPHGGTQPPRHLVFHFPTTSGLFLMQSHLWYSPTCTAITSLAA
jgi:hypothetical protein